MKNWILILVATFGSCVSICKAQDVSRKPLSVIVNTFAYMGNGGNAGFEAGLRNGKNIFSVALGGDKISPSGELMFRRLFGNTSARLVPYWGGVIGKNV